MKMFYIANTKLCFLPCLPISSINIILCTFSLPAWCIYFNIIFPSNFLFTKVHFPNGFNRNSLQAHVFLITPIWNTCKLLPLVQWLEHLLHIREFWAMVLSAVWIFRVFHRCFQILQRTVGVIWWFGQDLNHTWDRCYNTHVYLYSP